MGCCDFSIINPRNSCLVTWLLTWNITFWVKYSIEKSGESKTNQRYVNIQGYDVWRSCNVITTFFLWLSNQLLINSLIYIRIALCFSQALFSSAHWCIFNSCCLLKIWPTFSILVYQRNSQTNISIQLIYFYITLYKKSCCPIMW